MGLTTYDDEFLLAAIVIISMALIFYSVGVWSERIQALWAFWTFRKGSARAKRNFSRFSVIVWWVWLIPYFIGVYLGMTAKI